MLELIILIIAASYAAASALLQRRITNVERMYELRAKMNIKTKDLMALAKANAEQKVLAEKQKELTELSMQSMKIQMKPMLIILPIFLLLYYVILPAVIVSSATITVLSYKMSYKFFFIAAAFVTGILISLVASVYDRRRLKDKYNFGVISPSFKEPADTAQRTGAEQR